MAQRPLALLPAPILKLWFMIYTCLLSLSALTIMSAP